MGILLNVQQGDSFLAAVFNTHAVNATTEYIGTKRMTSLRQ